MSAEVPRIERHRIAELPSDIGDLMHLLVLDVRDTDLEELPETVGELSTLMSLRGTNNLWRSEIENLTSLQELVLGKVVMSPWFTLELSKLTELRMLEISFLDTGGLIEALIDSVRGLRRIKNLTLRFTEEVLVSSWDTWEPPRELCQFVMEGICLARLPVWVNSTRVPHLSYLRLKLMAVEAPDWEVLASMLELCYLCIYSTNSNVLESPLDDGHRWRKYGQKDVLGAKYPRFGFLSFILSFLSPICTYHFGVSMLWLSLMMSLMKTGIGSSPK